MQFYIEGRHLGPKPLLRGNIVTDVRCEPGVGVTISLDDKENLAWWMQISVTKQQLEEMLGQVNESSLITDDIP